MLNCKLSNTERSNLYRLFMNVEIPPLCMLRRRFACSGRNDGERVRHCETSIIASNRRKMTSELQHPVRDASLGRKMPLSHSLHAVDMQPPIGRIPNGMRRVVASLLSTERNIPAGCSIHAIIRKIHITMQINRLPNFVIAKRNDEVIR